MSVIKVKPWGKDQGDFVLINEDDFNAEVHELLDAPAEKASQAARRRPSNPPTHPRSKP